jgi:hypothetical protein
MRSSQRRNSQVTWMLAGAFLLAGACSSEDKAQTAPDAVSSGTAALEQAEQVELNSFSRDMDRDDDDDDDRGHDRGRKARVTPVLNCIDKVKAGQFIAHFGYDNDSSNTVTFNIGLRNRFFPSPANRGQPTKFAKGTHNDVFKVPFNGSILIWGLDHGVAIAHRTSKVCTTTPPPQCATDCDDKNPCTADVCDASTAFKCVHKSLSDGAACDDGNACNGGETCSAGVCKAGTALSCDDANPCTADKCDIKAGCVNTAVSDGTACPVSGNCGAGGACKAGKCAAAAGPNCDDNNPCTADSCAGGSTCAHTPIAAGVACSDGNSCNGNETCDGSGACKAGPTPDCDDKNPCTVDSCLTAGGCGHVAGNDGAACVVSGAAGSCTAGACMPTTVTCTDDGNPCTAEVVVNGVCTHPAAADDTACNDGNLCTQKDVCKSGACTGTLPVSCTGASACTTAGTCNPATGLCAGGTPKPAGTACDDSNLCTSNDACNATGQCVGAAKTCAATDVCHAAGTCDPASGQCSNPNAANGKSCDDAVKCTTGDVCTNGTCGGAAVVCAAPADSCHSQGVCTEATGVCTNPVKADGATCSDGNACTQTDTCAAGVCKGGNPVSCSGSGACTDAGTCNPATGACSGGAPKPNGTACNDGKTCTTGDVCTNGTCGGSAVVCPAPTDACHVQATCSEATGTCPVALAPAGTACNDGNACTQTDTCSATGVCTGANPVSCTGASACTNAGTCNPATGQCAGGTPKANGTVCNDGKTCTTGDVCTNGTCGGATVTCPAPSDSCHTQGTCQEATGLCNAPAAANGTTCSDGLTCTTGEVCTAGVCGGGAPKCAAGQTCSEPAGTCSGGGNLWDRSPACLTCEGGGVDTGDCDANIGCSKITTGAADIALCQALDTCMRKTGCWAINPLDCLCGTAVGTACAGPAANGVCKAEVIAATKTTDAVSNGTLFYSLNVPSGFATQQSACDHDICSVECKFP